MCPVEHFSQRYSTQKGQFTVTLELFWSLSAWIWKWNQDPSSYLGLLFYKDFRRGDFYAPLILAAVLSGVIAAGGVSVMGPQQKACCSNLASTIDPTWIALSLHLALVVRRHYVQQRDHLKEACVWNSIMEWSLSDPSVCTCCALFREPGGGMVDFADLSPLLQHSSGSLSQGLWEQLHTQNICAGKHWCASNDLQVNQKQFCKRFPSIMLCLNVIYTKKHRLEWTHVLYFFTSKFKQH